MATRKLFLVVLLLLGIAACSTAPKKHVAPKRSPAELARIPDAVPKVEPRSKLGNMKTYEVFGKRYYVLDNEDGFEQKGIASWYGPQFHGKKTSSGEAYDMYAMTAAHKTLPLPSYLEVENLENGRKVIVRVNDRGPFHDNRVVDLSYTAAIKLDMIAKGTALVEIRAINPGTHRGGAAPARPRSGAAKKGMPLDFYIQVGVFSDFNNAERLKNKLRALNTPVQLEATVLDSGVGFRVKIGPLNNIEVADEIVGRLEMFDIYDHRILLE
ncbi:MAG: septal ring lytic transglycosylase RlpA family protein [Gammaproteobacteria bacterium]|nr:septal ring lytic transglycosylase RlpA family protein [Gammaproteobacteria bacterium]